MTDYTYIDLIQRDGSVITVKAPTSTLCLVIARTIYDAFEESEWQSKRP